MFYLVLYHESREVEAIYLVQTEDKSDIGFMIKRDMDHCEVIQIPEPIWKAMLYTEKLVYRVIRPS